MPIQTFQCPNCGVKVEKIVKKGNGPPWCEQCPYRTTQVWSTPAVAQWKCSKGSL